MKKDIDDSLAWQRATQNVLHNDPTTAKVIFDTEDRLQNDHLPGYGDFCTNPLDWGYIAWVPTLIWTKDNSGSTNTITLNHNAGNYSLFTSVPIVAGNKTMEDFE